MIYFVYYNGDFYYVSCDPHYKHGKPKFTAFSREEAMQWIKANDKNCHSV